MLQHQLHEPKYEFKYNCQLRFENDSSQPYGRLTNNIPNSVKSIHCPHRQSALLLPVPIHSLLAFGCMTRMGVMVASSNRGLLRGTLCHPLFSFRAPSQSIYFHDSKRATESKKCLIAMRPAQDEKGSDTPLCLKTGAPQPTEGVVDHPPIYVYGVPNVQISHL
jgi:hypothetical protein